MPWLALASFAGALVADPQTIRVRSSDPRTQSLTGNTSITLSASPAGTGFSLVSRAQAGASAPIVITVTLANPASTSISVYGSFASASAALAAPSTSMAIPSNCILGMVPTGVPQSYTAFTQTGAVGAAGAGLELLSISSLVSDYTATATLFLKIDLTNLPTLPAGTYSGTLYLQAQAL